MAIQREFNLDFFIKMDTIAPGAPDVWCKIGL